MKRAGSTEVTEAAAVLQRACRRLVLGATALLCACAAGPQTEEARNVVTGLDALLRDGPGPLAGRRIGLITNHTGVDRKAAFGVDRLLESPQIQLVALFSPEHSITGVVEAGEHMNCGVYGATGIPIHSLYGETRKPTAEMLEGVDVLVSVGRGTDAAFSQIGAPWIDADSLAAQLDRYDLPGVRFDAVTYTPLTPGDGKYGDTAVHGVRLVTTDRSVYDPTHAGIAALVEMRALYGASLTFRNAHFDRLAGTERVRTMLTAGATVDQITSPWDSQLAAFAAVRERYLLYP